MSTSTFCLVAYETTSNHSRLALQALVVNRKTKRTYVITIPKFRTPDEAKSLKRVYSTSDCFSPDKRDAVLATIDEIAFDLFGPPEVDFDDLLTI